MERTRLFALLPRAAPRVLLTGRVASPLREIAESARISQRAADRIVERHDTASAVPAFGEALPNGDVSGGHLDVLRAGIR